MPIGTIAEVKDAILRKHDKYSAEFELLFDNEIEQWIWQLADVFPFWFLTVVPGTILQEAEAFPISDLSSVTGVYPSPLPSGQRHWVDAGWLRTNPGQAVYDFALPEEDAEADNPSWWRACMVKQVDFVFEVNKSGAPCRDIPIPEYEGGMLRTSLAQRGTPEIAMWRNVDNAKSQIVFSPTPKEQRLYAVQFVVKNPRNYVDPDTGATRNRFLTHAPDAVVAKGLYEAAKHFDEAERIAFYSRELYGASPDEWAASAKLSGGILGRLKRDTTVRSRQMRESVEYWRSLSSYRGGNNTTGSNREAWNNPFARRWWR